MTTPDALRDLDRRIAEAKGLKPWDGPDGLSVIVYAANGDAEFAPSPAYTTSWQHAGPLMEEMAADRDCTILIGEPGFGLYYRDGLDLVYHFGSFSPEAVCRAWLVWREARG